MAKKDKVIFSKAGQTHAFDVAGKQIAELQVPWILLWAKHAEEQGYDPTQFQVKLPLGKAGIERNEDGSFTWVPF